MSSIVFHKAFKLLDFLLDMTFDVTFSLSLYIDPRIGGTGSTKKEIGFLLHFRILYLPGVKHDLIHSEI